VSLRVVQASRTQTRHEPETGASVCETAEDFSPEPDTAIKGKHRTPPARLLHAVGDDTCSPEWLEIIYRSMAGTNYAAKPI
jgi:hypothetical protein